MFRGLVAALVLLPITALAQDHFEIQVYDSETANPRDYGLELHTNYVESLPAFGSDNGIHLTFEPHYGLTHWLELGGYLQTAYSSHSGLGFAGAKLRLKARVPGRFVDDVFGFALNGEVSYVPAPFEANAFGSELRPIIDAKVGRFYASVNPIIVIDLGGPEAGVPKFEPAAKTTLTLVGRLAVGAEYYAGLGPFRQFSPAQEQTHWLLGVLDFAADVVDLNLGFGHGLSPTDGFILKAIVGIHPPEEKPQTPGPRETEPSGSQ